MTTLVPPSDPVLWTPTRKVVYLPEVLRHVHDMKALLGTDLGLGATQVGVGLRFFLMRHSSSITTCINPEWYPTDENGKGPQDGIEEFPLDMMMEGCLTWPGRFRFVNRFKYVRLSYRDEAWYLRRNMRFDGVSARIIQHECDHLDGGCIFPRPDGSPETNPLTVGFNEVDASREFMRAMAEQRKVP